MGLIHFVLHALNFLAPAALVALLLPVLDRYVLRNSSQGWSWWLQSGILFAVGALVLFVGLLLFGVDGKMLSYLALVLGSATCQWLLTRGGRAKTGRRGR